MSDDCPKCGETKRGESCPKCGLVFAKFDPAVMDALGTERLRELYRQLQADWDNAALHALFVEQAFAQGQAGFAASVYRRRGEDPKSKEQLDRISNRLVLTLQASRSQSDPESTRGHPSRILVPVMTLLLLLVLGALALMLTRA